MGNRAKKSKIAWTDKAQAIAALTSIPFAIVGFIIAWCSLKQSDEALQKQISRLDTLTNENIKHTKILSDELNTLDSTYKFYLDQDKRQGLQRQSDLKPILSISFEMYNGDIISAFLINDGNTARIIKILENSPNDFLINIPNKTISKNSVNAITFQHKNPVERSDKSHLDFTLIFEDIDKKQYEKRFKYGDIQALIDDQLKNKIVTQ